MVELANGGVAVMTEQAAGLAGGVIVIKTERTGFAAPVPLAVGPLANGADATLLFQEVMPKLWRRPVHRLVVRCSGPVKGYLGVGCARFHAV